MLFHFSVVKFSKPRNEPVCKVVILFSDKFKFVKCLNELCRLVSNGMLSNKLHDKSNNSKRFKRSNDLFTNCIEFWLRLNVFKHSSKSKEVASIETKP